MRTRSPFAALLERLIAASPYHNRQAFAEAIGVYPSQLSRAMSGDPAGVFGPERCLQIARVTNEPPGVVLRAAGHDSFATLLEQVYGDPKSPDERIVLNMLALLQPHVRADIVSMLQRMYKPAPAPRRPRSKRQARRKKLAVAS